MWLAYKDYIHYYLITRSINIRLCVSVCIDTRVLIRPKVLRDIEHFKLRRFLYRVSQG